MTSDRASRKDWAPKVPKAEKKKGAKRDRTPAHEAIREQYRDHYLPRRAMRAKALRTGMTSMSLAEVCNCENPYWETANSLYSLESGHSFTSEVGLLWWAKRLGIHPALVWVNRPNYIKGWDELLNQIIHVFELTPDGSKDCQFYMDELHLATMGLMDYYQKREEYREKLKEQEEKVVTIPAHLIDGMKEALIRNEADRKANEAEIERLKAELRKHGIDL